MLEQTKKYFFMLLLIVGSCDRRTDNKVISEIGLDSLAMFPLDSWMTFVNTNANDQIALLFKRDTLNTFKYRIELLRKWKSLPLDQGVLQLKKIESDSVYTFGGGNSDCEVVITIYNAESRFKFGRNYVKLERNCKNDSLDISVDEFQKLWYK